MKKASARLTDLCAKRGSYILEAALTLPVLIICVVSLVLVVKIAAVSEGVCFTAARELREQSLRACSYITDVSLCKNMEKQVLEEQEALTDFRVLKSRVGYAQGGIDDLLTVDSLSTFTDLRPALWAGPLPARCAIPRRLRRGNSPERAQLLRSSSFRATARGSTGRSAAM